MKILIDLEKAGLAETFGALAIGGRRARRRAAAKSTRFTRPQMRALSEIANSFVEIAREAGAQKKRIRIGAISLELSGNGTEEVLSIRKAAA